MLSVRFRPEVNETISQGIQWVKIALRTRANLPERASRRTSKSGEHHYRPLQSFGSMVCQDFDSTTNCCGTLIVPGASLCSQPPNQAINGGRSLG